jgi:hypothetical protein
MSENAAARVPRSYDGRVRGALAVVAVAAVVAASAASSAAPRARAVATYCSPSGDLCFGVFDRSGAVYLELTTFARYFGRYRLCVRPPGRAERCGSFPIRRSGRLWGSTIKYGRQFPVAGPGVYRVTWKLGTQRLGPTLRFRLPLRR